MKFILISIFLSANCFCQRLPERVPISTDEMAIEAANGSSREVAFTNKQAGVYYTETNGVHRSGWQGWRVMSTEILENYSISIDGKKLNPTESSAKAYPHKLVRKYRGDIQETFTLLDSMNAFIVELNGLNRKEISICPYFSDSFDSEDYEVVFESGVLLIAKKKHLVRTSTENYPVWVGITTGSLTSEVDYDPDSIGQSFSPAGLKSVISNPQSVIAFVAGDAKSQTISLAKQVVQNYPTLIEKRKRRMEDLLNYSYVRTNNKRFDKALYWAKISMDALIMNQRGKGVFAGLPWFDNYWGRDSFISLTGATLVTGDFKDAKEILRSFAAWQDTNPNSTNYGRIPNLVTTNSISYNTADGTSLFVIALGQYVYYAGDTAFAREMYPVVKRSIEGTIKYHMDSLGFLTHGDAETWMDAVGPDGPWSPRGNRANDVQMLWFDQLGSGADYAILYHDTLSMENWIVLDEKLRINFRKYFINKKDSLLFDHLTQDGIPNTQIRPNQLSVLNRAILDRAIETKIFQTVTSELVYPHGVASLSQKDTNFHPYHHFEPYYVQDAAYHNGIVWTWLAGKWIDIATKYRHPDLAFEITDKMIDQILDQGAIGTLSELVDAVPRKGEKTPRLSGAFSQAWSLAEFIRNFYQSYLGIKINSLDKRVEFHPSLPLLISDVNFVLAFDTTSLNFQVSQSTDNLKLTTLLSPYSEKKHIFVEWRKRDGGGQSFHYDLNPDGNIMLNVNLDSVEVEDSHNAKYYPSSFYNILKNRSKDFEDYTVFDELKLAKPFINPDLKCLKLPSHRLLANSEIKQSNPMANILYDVSDPIGDDKGTGSYIYPQIVNFKPGSLDITHFTVSSDDRNVYFKLQFRNLSNPGWHPEYGFQLTYSAIAINKGDKNGETHAGMNSNYVFADGFHFQSIIYIGGGFRIMNDSGIILAEYLPVSGDEKNPLGNVSLKTIEFSVPIKLLGEPQSNWRYAVLVGAQDDHGGAGIGEFRSVEAEAKEWVGGGKKNPNDPNVYDVILPH